MQVDSGAGEGSRVSRQSGIGFPAEGRDTDERWEGVSFSALLEKLACD